jgi:hypothetical protein
VPLRVGLPAAQTARGDGCQQLHIKVSHDCGDEVEPRWCCSKRIRHFGTPVSCQEIWEMVKLCGAGWVRGRAPSSPDFDYERDISVPPFAE